MRPFDPDQFCQRLVDSGPQLTTGIKGDWVRTIDAGSYTRWLITLRLQLNGSTLN